MSKSVAVIGAGVSGLTSAIALAEAGHRVTIFAAKSGQETTSGVAAAIWFPYDAKPEEKVIAWALTTFDILRDLTEQPQTGVSMIEQRIFSRRPGLQIPGWALALGARQLSPPNGSPFLSGFSVVVPLTDTTIYLDYLNQRFQSAGGRIREGVEIARCAELASAFTLIVNCSGIGARELAQDRDLEPHRGQVALMAKLNLAYAMVCDDAPLMYVIPRSRDCVFGGTNTVSNNLARDPDTTSRIVAECRRSLNLSQAEKLPVLAERVGLRPFRRSGVRLEAEKLADGRVVIHNYGHGGAGFTLSWGCALEVATLIESHGGPAQPGVVPGNNPR